MEMMNWKPVQTESDIKNYLSFWEYYDWLKNIALNIFEWKNLPPTIPEYFIERVLFERGQIVFFKDPEIGLLCLPGSSAGVVNIYGEPVAFNVHGFNYNDIVGENTLEQTFSRKIESDEAVLIWNNLTKTPTERIIRAFASRLGNVERVTDTNLNAQRTPILLLGDEKSILTLKNVYKKFDGGAPVIYGDKNFMNQESINAVNTTAPYIIDKLDTHKQNLWNECLTYLGIQNANTDKKERLITDEVNANNQNVETNKEIMLTCRERAAEQINKKFGTNISVNIRGGEEEIEPIHDRTEKPDTSKL